MGARIASGKPADGEPVGAFSGAPGTRGENADRPAQTAVLLRTRLRALRQAMSDAQRESAGASIAARLSPWLASWVKMREREGHDQHVIAGFWPIGAEPDLRVLLSRLAGQAGVRVALPVVERRAAPLVFHAWTPDTVMKPGDFGIAEPAGTPVLVPDLLLVPLLGFTDDADRIGYGGGFYDRTLAALRDSGNPAIAIGIAFSCCRLAPGEHVPEAHDYRLDAVLHESGWTPSEP